MIRNILITGFLLVLAYGIASAQCNEPLPPGTDCESAPVLCESDLEGYCSNNPSTSNNVAPPPFCATSVDNAQWIAFVAGSETIQLSIDVSECEGSNAPPQGGIQAELFGQSMGNCENSGFFSVSNCYTAGNPNTTVMLTTNQTLEIGAIYYLVIDGWSFDQCLWEVSVTQGNTSPPDLNDPGPFTGPSTVCPGLSSVVYSIPPITGATDYIWTTDCGSIIGNGTAAVVDFPPGVTGPCQICVEAEAPCSENSSGCFEVDVQAIPETFIDTTICLGESATDPCGIPHSVAGTYTCILQNAVGCDSTIFFTVNIAQPTFGTLEKTICDDEEIVIQTPNGPISFNGANGPAFLSLTFPGANAEGCDSTLDITINVESVFATTVSLNESCDEFNDGQIFVTPIVGTPPFNYTWSEPTLNGIQNPNNLPPGIYTVTVTSFYNCTYEETIVIEEAVPISITTDDITDVGCPGDNDGSISISVSGGNPTYIYLWSDPNIGNTPNATNLAGGNYSVTVLDVAGCSQLENFTVGEPDPLELTVVSVNDIGCNGETTGSIEVTTSGGVQPYTYAWSDASIGNDPSPSGLSAGNYSVTVTDDNGCTDTEDMTIAEPPVLDATINGSDLGCNGDASGSIDLTVTGGTPGYTFTWSDPTIGDVEDPTGLDAGAYSVTVTDAGGCTVVRSATLNEPGALNITITGTDLACNSDNSGAISVLVNGGNPPYTYTWSDGNIGNTPNPGNLAAGPYTVTVTDDNGCSNEDNITLNEPAELVLTSENESDVSCNGDNDGSIEVSTTGGTQPYTYTWSDGNIGNTPNATDLVAGNYSVTVEDANGCTDVYMTTINEPTELTASAAPTNLLCNADNSGSIDVTVSGGTGNYSFDWLPSLGDVEDPANLAAGNYSVTITDEAGCTAVTSTTLTEPAELVVSATGTDLLCNGNGAGSITITRTGGTTPITYTWSDPGISNVQNPTGLDAGMYMVTATDANGCTATASVTLTEPPLLEITVDGTSDVTCNGDNDGTIDVSSTGGTPPYQYAWNLSSIGNNPNPTGLAPGTYQVTVTDDNGCTAVTSASLTEPTSLAASSAITNLTCNSDNSGSIDITVSGGTPGYTFAWNDTNIGDTEDPTGLAAGDYEVTVTDANGCTVVVSSTITQPTELTANAIGTNLDCNGDNSGSITVIANGGTGDYTFAWSDGSIGDTDTPTGLAADNYEVTVTDENGCTAVANATLTEPALLEVTLSSVDISCFNGNDGVIDLTVTGGTTPYTFNWSATGIGNVEDATNLPIGTYDVLITDANGCTTETSATLTQPTELQFSSTSVDASCGDNNGSIDISVSGGIAPYDFNWSNDNFDGTEDPNGLAPGTYSVTVTDGNGCTIIGSESVNTPSGLAASAIGADASCNAATDGSVDLTVSGGSQPYTYVWNDPAFNGLEDLTDLPAGIYNVTVIDDIGCEVTASATVNEPDVLEVSGSSVNAVCGEPNGSISLTITGGTQPYNVDWSDDTLDGIEDPVDLFPGMYSAVITDANDCVATIDIEVDAPEELLASVVVTDVLCFDENTGAIDVSVTGGTTPYQFTWNNIIFNGQEDIADVAASNYSVTVTDADGCTVVIDTVITQPTDLTAALTSTNVNCNGVPDGTITLDVQGGVAPYTYNWNDDTYDGTENPTGVAPGTYNVTVTDDNGCTAAATAVTITQPPLLQVFGSTVNAICGEPNGSIDMTIQGGTAPYDIVWSDPTFNGVEDPNGLLPASYDVTVTDANGCEVLETFNVIEPDALAASATTADVGCFSESTGEINVTVTGGNPPYQFDWSDDTYDTQEDITDLPAGSYSLTITDGDGCSVVVSEIINEPTELMASLASTDVICNGAADGTLELDVVGGTPGYTYTWSDATLDGTEDPFDLGPATYTVTVTDLNGCTVTASATVAQPAALSVTTDALTDADCQGASTGSVEITVNGGIAPYTFDWSDDTLDGIEDPGGLAAGTYDLIITDANDCTFNYSVTVDEPTGVSIDAVTVTDVDCNGSATGLIELALSGGTTPYIINWSNGASGIFNNGIVSGDYDATITDGNGCELISNLITVNEPEALDVAASFVKATCGLPNGSIALDITGGVMPYEYTWSDTLLGNVEDPTGLNPGLYEVTVTDANACTFETSITVETPDELVASATNTPTSCFDGADGTISVEVMGGTEPYVYDWSDDTLDGVEDPAGLAAGTYDLTITDADGCEVVVSSTVAQPTELTLGIDGTNLFCNGDASGTISVSSSGATPPYTYAWSDGSIGDVPSPNGLAAGFYEVTVTDANACTATISITLTEPDVVELSITSESNISCNGNGDGSISVEAIGGTMPYEFEWNPSNIGNTPDATDLMPGDYSVTVTDANGCSAEVSATLTEPTAVTASAEPTNLLCNNDNTGNIDLTVDGGVGGYTYNWSQGSIGDVEDPQGLAAGAYSVTVTDASGCTTTVSGIIVTEPAELTAQAFPTQATCGDPNGSIDVAVLGGTMPYDYAWDNPTASGSNPTDLLAGDYEVTVTDANGCEVILQINVPEPAELVVTSIDGTNVSCNQGTNGTITVQVTGGQGTYNYAWSDPSATGPNPTDLSAGTYTVTVTDANNCEAVASFEITEPSALQTQIGGSDVSCFSGSDGSINFTVTGGTPPYDYLWNNGAGTVAEPQNLSANTYNVLVTDANGCQITDEVTISQPSAISLSAQSSSTLCNGSADGSISLTAGGGTPPYTYLWSNGDINEDPQNLTAGSYSVTITDDNGCTATLLNQVVDEPEPISISIDLSVFGTFNVSCSDSQDGTAQAIAEGGQPPYSYNWSNGETISTLRNIEAGTYTVTITDDNGCTAEQSATLTAPSAISASLIGAGVSCNGDDDGIIFIENVAGGIPPYTYSLNNGVQESPEPVFPFLEANDYNITIIDAEGCTWEETVLVDEPEELVVTLGDDQTIILGETIDLIAQVNNPFNLEIINWTGLTDTIFDPESLIQTITPFETRTYAIEVLDSAGCRATDDIRIFVDKQRPIFVPTAFSPNGDGFNDRLFIGGGDNVVQINEFSIFNRWGEAIFTAQNFQPNIPAEGWDGTFKGDDLDPGVFVYFAEVLFIDGKEIIFKGSITLVR